MAVTEGDLQRWRDRDRDGSETDIQRWRDR